MSRLPTLRPSLLDYLVEQKRGAARQARTSAFARSGTSVTAEGVTTVDGTQNLTGDLNVSGEFSTLDTDGSVLLKSGTQEYGDRGLTIRRDDGGEALVVKRTFSAGDPFQSLRLFDRSARAIGGDSIISPTGFDAPHVPIPFTPSDVTTSAYARTTSSATFVPLFEHDGFRQNPGLRLKVKAWCSNGTTTADIQVWDVLGGAYLDTFLGSPPPSVINVPLATTTPTVFESESMVLPGWMSDPMQIEIHAKVTAGTGSVSVAVLRSIGYGI